jgi:hypothetical protein
MKRAIQACAAIAALAALPSLADDIVGVYRTPTTTYYYTAPPTYYYTEPAPSYYYPAPAVTTTTTTTYVEDPIVVTAPRDTDAAITDDVAYAIASDPRISGRIGVETYRGEVSLSGRVTTPGQADRAESLARSVDGVADVHNYLNTRVGR